jgi:hypothetical protein
MVTPTPKPTCLYRLPTQRAHKSYRMPVVGPYTPLTEPQPPTFYNSYSIGIDGPWVITANSSSSTKMPSLTASFAPLHPSSASYISHTHQLPVGIHFWHHSSLGFCRQNNFLIIFSSSIIFTNPLH